MIASPLLSLPPTGSFADTTKQSVHPHVATVTYLSDFGAPTMAVTQLPIAAGTSEFRHGFVSHPRLGKHMSFDGRYLHGVPPELMAARTPTTYTRITVLVNVWLSHALTEVSRWPDADVPTVSHAPLDAVNLEVTRVPFAAAVAAIVLRSLPPPPPRWQLRCLCWSAVACTFCGIPVIVRLPDHDSWVIFSSGMGLFFRVPNAVSAAFDGSLSTCLPLPCCRVPLSLAQLSESTEKAAHITQLKTPSTARCRGFVFGGEGEEHEIWFPVLPPCGNDSQAITFGVGTAKIVRVGGKKSGGGGGGGGGKKKRSKK